jgi:hypothetical protein
VMTLHTSVALRHPRVARHMLRCQFLTDHPVVSGAGFQISKAAVAMFGHLFALSSVNAVVIPSFQHFAFAPTAMAYGLAD